MFLRRFVSYPLQIISNHTQKGTWFESSCITPEKSLQRQYSSKHVSNQLIYTVSKLQEKTILYLNERDTAQAGEKCFQAVNLANKNFVRLLESKTGIKIEPKDEVDPWNYHMHRKFVRLLMKRLDDNKALEVTAGWSHAFECHVVGWSQNSMSVEDMETAIPYIFRMINIIETEVVMDKELAIFLKKNLFNLDLN